ncbi:MAG: hypothetical protein ACHQXL_09515, partial [Candidatus Limnocylindrales bacterium]
MTTRGTDPSRAGGPPPPRARPRELGVRIGLLPTGPPNSIVDVEGIRVGHRSVWRDEPTPPVGLVCGDDRVARETQAWFPWAERVVVKE